MGQTVALFLKKYKKSSKLKNNFLINGDVSNKINPFDRGLSFGDGVFRTFLVVNGLPINWEMHYKKLKSDANVLKIKLPKKELLLLDIQKLFNVNKSYIGKIIVTRGISNQGYQYDKKIKCTRILLKIDYKKIKKDYYTKGVKLKVCKTQTSYNESYSGIKHLNRIDNVLAKSELSNSFFDGIMLDKNGYINECISSNIFVRYGKNIIIPKQKNSGVSGVCKEIIIKNAHLLKFNIKHQYINLVKLKKADEVIIANSVFGAVYANQIEDKKWKDGLFSKLIQDFIVSPK